MWWCFGPLYPEIFYRFYEKPTVANIWYFDKNDMRNWAVVNGLIKKYHSVSICPRLTKQISDFTIFNILQEQYFIPRWLRKLYQRCRVDVQRVEPQQPWFPSPITGPREFLPQATPTTLTITGSYSIDNKQKLKMFESLMDESTHDEIIAHFHV